MQWSISGIFHDSLPWYHLVKDHALPWDLDLLHLWYSEVVKAGRLWLFKAITTNTAASLPSSTLHSLKCDWWQSHTCPSSVLWHTGEAKASWERNRGELWGVGFELHRCHCKSEWPQWHLTQYIRVKSATLTVWHHARRGYNSSGTLGQEQHSSSSKPIPVIKKYSFNTTPKSTQKLKHIDSCVVEFYLSFTLNQHFCLFKIWHHFLD